MLLPLLARGEDSADWSKQTPAAWGRQLSDADIRVRWYAAYVLGQLGPRAAEAVPALEKALANTGEQEYVRGTEAWALGRMGPAAADAEPLLVKMLVSKHVSVRRNASEALGRFGPAAKRTVPDLLKLRGDDDPVVRVNTNVALWRGRHRPSALAALVQMLREGKDPTAYHAAEALGPRWMPSRSFPPAHPLTPALSRKRRARLARFCRRWWRPWAAMTPTCGVWPPVPWARSGPRPCRPWRRFSRMAPRRSVAAPVEALGWMGADAVSPLTAALACPQAAARRAAARALGRLGPAAREAESALVEAVNDPQPEVRAAAAKAVTGCDSRDTDSVPCRVLLNKTGS